MPCFMRRFIPFLMPGSKPPPPAQILVLQAFFGDMLNQFHAPRHRLSHLIQGMLDVNARILKYGSVSDTGPGLEPS